MLCFKKHSTDVLFCTPLSETSPFLVRSHEQGSVPASLDNCPAQLAVQQPILSGKGETGNGKRRVERRARMNCTPTIVHP